MASELVAYCGLYCGACSFKLAAEEQNRLHLICMPAAYDHLKQAPLDPCPGCRLENTCGPCAIRDCARTKGIDVCRQCAEFPCARLQSFAADGKPHHAEVIKNLELLEAKGETAWLKYMNCKWTCSQCGVRRSWYYKSCTCAEEI
jgi:hypothetical protein